jgi:hypothetical protein
LGRTVTVTDDTHPHCGTQGQIERLYWRGEERWVRMRTRDGRWLSLPARQTDLPALTDTAPSSVPMLSPQSLLALARHLKRRDLPSCQAHEKVSSC